MWHALFPFTKSWSTRPDDDAVDGHTRASVAVVDAAAPPSFHVDARAHERQVRLIQREARNRGVSPLGASARLHTVDSSTPRRRSPHPYADPDVTAAVSSSVAAINTLIGTLLDRRDRSRLCTTAFTSPRPPQSSPTRASGLSFSVNDTWARSCLADGSAEGEERGPTPTERREPSWHDKTRPFTAGPENAADSDTGLMLAALSLVDREGVQRAAIVAAEASCWSTLHGTLTYVCRTASAAGVSCPTQSPTRSLAMTSPSSTPALSTTVTTDAPGLCATLTLPSSLMSHGTLRSEGRASPRFGVATHNAAVHPYAVVASPAAPSPHRLLASRSPSPCAPSCAAVREPFLRPLPLNAPLSSTAHNALKRHHLQPAQPYSPPPPALRLLSPSRRSRQPLLSPSRDRLEGRGSVLLSPPAPPPLVPASSNHTSLHDDEKTVTWVPVTRDEDGRLCVAWGAWDPTAAATPVCTRGLGVPGASRPRTLDDDECEPFVELSALTVSPGRQPPLPCSGGPRWPESSRQARVGAREPSIHVLATHVDASPPAWPTEGEAAGCHSQCAALRIEASEISTLNLSDTGLLVSREEDYLPSCDGTTPLRTQRTSTSPPRHPRSYQGAIVYSL